jgi:glycosyltransferase involved in cell wall biosynthesis
MPQKKYVVVHSGKRDAYQIASSLAAVGQLEKLVTDDYILRYFINGERTIPLALVHTSWMALLNKVLYIFTKKIKFQKKKDRRLSKAAAKICNEHRALFLTYSYYAFPGFNILDSGIKKILFQLHPHPMFLKKLFKEEIRLLPIAKSSLGQEHEMRADDIYITLLGQEASQADHVLCASSFTKATLIEELNINNIKVIPYGVDTTAFPFVNRSIRKEGDIMRVLFVGSLNQRKGVYYLLNSIYEIQKFCKVELVIVGRGIFESSILDSFKIDCLHIHQDVTQKELIAQYHKAHVFVLPSIGEGFGQVLLEAMSTGLPVISTFHTSCSDLVVDGVEGYTIPIRSVKLLNQKLQFLFRNPNDAHQMGVNASKKSQQFTNDLFSQRLIESLNGV